MEQIMWTKNYLSSGRGSPYACIPHILTTDMPLKLQHDTLLRSKLAVSLRTFSHFQHVDHTSQNAAVPATSLWRA